MKNALNAPVQTRREFIHAVALAGATAAQRQAVPATHPADAPRLRKAIPDALLPKTMPPIDRFRLAADLGFQGIEAAPPEDDGAVDAFRAAADRAGIPIHSVMNVQGNWAFPLSSEKAEVASKGFDLLCRSLRVAAAWQANNVLLVPAQVTPNVRYEEAWVRSQAMLRRALPLAEELGVCIAIENVGNRFLLSPMEFARYIDEMAHPKLRAYFDVGNCLVLWGYPQDWLLTLGGRACKIHLKDCRFSDKKFVPLGEGDVDWGSVRRAIRQNRYSGFVTIEPNYASAELERGDRNALADLARRMDRVLREA